MSRTVSDGELMLTEEKRWGGSEGEKRWGGNGAERGGGGKEVVREWMTI